MAFPTTTLTPSSTRNNLGPLTTTWTPPGNCSYTWVPDGPFSTFFLAQAGCSTDTQITDEITCWPPNTLSYTPEPPFTGLGFYSPGLVCPQGYSTACAVRALSDGNLISLSEISTFDFEYYPIHGETIVGCCPTGYNCFSSTWGQTCLKNAYQTMLTSVTYCGGPLYSSVQIPAIEGIGDTPIATVSYATILAPMFQINWQATDLPVSTSVTTTTTIALSTSSSSTSSISASTGAASPSPSSSSNDHSKIVAAVVVPIAFVIITAVTGIYFRRRRSQKCGNTTNLSGTENRGEFAGNGEHNSYELPGGKYPSQRELPMIELETPLMELESPNIGSMEK